MDSRITTIRSRSQSYTGYLRTSSLEDRFAHVAKELVARWKTDLIDPYMNSLLIDTRGGRQGFPADAQEELMFLSGVLWHRQHENAQVKCEEKPERFSFSAVNENDMRRCGTTGSWVLI